MPYPLLATIANAISGVLPLGTSADTARVEFSRPLPWFKLMVKSNMITWRHRPKVVFGIVERVLVYVVDMKIAPRNLIDSGDYSVLRTPLSAANFLFDVISVDKGRPDRFRFRIFSTVKCLFALNRGYFPAMSRNVEPPALRAVSRPFAFSISTNPAWHHLATAAGAQMVYSTSSQNCPPMEGAV
jgi:hypothetical protein